MSKYPAVAIFGTMGCGQSALRNEISSLKSQLMIMEQSKQSKIQDLERDKAKLKYKISVLEEIVRERQCGAHVSRLPPLSLMRKRT